MLRLRPYKPCDAEKILSWCRDESTFWNWVGTRYAAWPITPSDMNRKYFEANGDCPAADDFYPMTAFDDGGPVGHLTLRFTDREKLSLRFSFVILDDSRRGQGLGKEMLELALRYAFEILKVHRVSLGVFEDNLPAGHCYRAAGFRDLGEERVHTVTLKGRARRMRNMEITQNIYSKGEI